MLVDVNMNTKVKIELKPGDTVRCLIYNEDFIVRRVVESESNVYAVFGQMWRPMSTYGRTWRKVES